jgi:hypothetical protein
VAPAAQQKRKGLGLEIEIDENDDYKTSNDKTQQQFNEQLQKREEI